MVTQQCTGALPRPELDLWLEAIRGRDNAAALQS